MTYLSSMNRRPQHGNIIGQTEIHHARRSLSTLGIPVNIDFIDELGGLETLFRSSVWWWCIHFWPTPVEQCGEEERRKGLGRRPGHQMGRPLSGGMDKGLFFFFSITNHWTGRCTRDARSVICLATSGVTGTSQFALSVLSR